MRDINILDAYRCSSRTTTTQCSCLRISIGKRKNAEDMQAHARQIWVLSGPLYETFSLRLSREPQNAEAMRGRHHLVGFQHCLQLDKEGI